MIRSMVRLFVGLGAVLAVSAWAHAGDDCETASYPNCDGFCAGGVCGPATTAGANCECQFATGACCYEDIDLTVAGGGQFCTEIFEGFCTEGLNGQYLGDFTTCDQVSCDPNSNDTCDEAIQVSVPSATPGTTIGSTFDGAPFCGTSNTSGGVWYQVIGTGNTITASTCESTSDGSANYDTKISVYCPNCDDLNCVAGNDDFGGCSLFFHSHLSWCSELGQTYLILVHGFSSATGDFVLALSDNQLTCNDAVSCTQSSCENATFPTCGGSCTGGETCVPDFENCNATAGGSTDCRCACLTAGACCLVDSQVAGEACFITTESFCNALAQQGYQYQGDGTTCQQDTCAPAGACCFEGGDCADGTQANCESAGAAYQGDGTTCDNIVCPLSTTPPRVSTSHKGSALIFSKIEVKWNASGNLIQDTFLDLTNDYPEGVTIQAYFINGDVELEALFDNTGALLREYEPGWNTADCRFQLTGNQPHYWSAAHGSGKCQRFTVLDEKGPGRLDPETSDGSRILRGYAIFYAVAFVELHNPGTVWWPIQWNHLKGDAVLVNYANGTAWEYNAWAFRAHNSVHGAPVGHDPGTLNLDGRDFDAPYASLIFDFYGSGSTVLSGGGQTVMIDTDLTLHAVSADLRQDGCGPVLTKVEAPIWNEFESKFSGTRRCICCWDQTMISDWVRRVDIPNYFMSSALRTDKGKARLDGLGSIECDYEELCGPSAYMKRWNNCFDTIIDPPIAGIPNGFYGGSENAAILGLSTKFLAFSPSGRMDTAGGNLAGAGTESARIRVDVDYGPSEGRSGETSSTTKGGIR